ncbi:abhydrolase domain-containing protein [Elysia marginata]|uniref:Abhydrolase domain-containing protein n=1 Tax=Elysia marginata TaxID=1093978 RepID=A0AAV4GQ57_9GAST|nr:abhydrolase domain-containing protein [Elysia marginata]
MSIGRGRKTFKDFYGDEESDEDYMPEIFVPKSDSPVKHETSGRQVNPSGINTSKGVGTPPDKSKTVQGAGTPDKSKTVQGAGTPDKSKTVQGAGTPDKSKPSEKDKTANKSRPFKEAGTSVKSKTSDAAGTSDESKTYDGAGTSDESKTFEGARTSDKSKTSKGAGRKSPPRRDSHYDKFENSRTDYTYDTTRNSSNGEIEEATARVETEWFGGPGPRVYRRAVSEAENMAVELCPDGDKVTRNDKDVMSEPSTVCNFCRKTSTEPLKRCARCRAVSYCNKTCQRDDFKQHKEFCRMSHFLKINLYS